ncbi:hypothetical protein LCM02_10385 [Lutimonas saemankumensis]|uniref:hypothetical protein n=1 Tax=Lutimonas saemankumensis TaxID=483016 RepID=UPI001CD6D05D|nr:hypothetical protein [Lutimonas saemankumensis]MCA0932858.1 hypothetical protein [Lutimonas saemankumensis]
MNTNVLIANGISPRVLDFAANSALQDGWFKENVKVKVSYLGNEEEYFLQSIYDPSYTEGLDIRMVIDSENSSKKSNKLLKESIKNLHHFSRLVEQYLYDETTMKILKNEGGEIVVEYFYRRISVDPSMTHVKRLKGEVYLKNGELEMVKLTNTRPLKKGVDNYVKMVHFEKIPNGIGHFVSKAEESYQVSQKGEPLTLRIETETLTYGERDGEVLFNSQSKENVSMFEKPDTLTVKLGGVLPFFGKPAAKLGYQLPRPVGVSLLTHGQSQELQFTGLSLGLNGGDLVELDGVFLLEESSLTQSTLTYIARADVWIFPFLNVMGLVGRAENNVNGNLVLTDEIKALLELLGQDVPDALNLNVDATANLIGGGATMAAGIEDINLTLNYQYLIADVPDVGARTNAQTLTAMIGYMLPFGMNIMAGAQGQFYDTEIGGSISIGEDQTLDYLVDFEPRNWNFFGGVYKGFAKHWEITLQAGIGSRNSLTAMLGYRF